MAKKQDASKPDFFATMLQTAEQDSGFKRSYLPASHKDRMWGIPIPWLPLQWLLGGINIIPYGTLLELAGKPGAMKSSLLIELMRIVGSEPVNGLGVYFDVENKTGPTFLPALLWNDERLLSGGRVQVVGGLGTIQGWQTEVMAHIDRVIKLDPESRHPVLLGVDSIMGRLEESQQEKFEKEGEGQSRGYPIAAMSIGNFVRGLPTKLLREDKPCLPVVFLAINQLMTKIDSNTYVPGSYTAGGSRKDFQAGIRLWMTRTDRTDYSDKTLNAYMPKELREQGIEMWGEGGCRTIKLKAEKSSLGLDERDLYLDIYHGFDREGRQYSWFDWSTALLSLLQPRSKSMEEKQGGFGVVMGSDKKSFNITVDGKSVFDKLTHSVLVGEWLTAQPELMKFASQFFHICQCRAHTDNRSAKEVFSEPIA